MPTSDTLARGRTAAVKGEHESRREATWLKKLALLAISSLVVLGLLEIGFRVAGYRPIYDVYSNPAKFWQYDALLGWSLEAGAQGEFVGPEPFPIEFRSDVAINSRGLRGAEISDVPAGGLRVLVLGDSQAAGFEVSEDATYAALVEERLGERLGVEVQVVNAAVRGYGTDQAYLQYRERLQDLDADLVLYHATANDPEDNVTLHRMRRPFGKPAFALDTGGSLQLVGTPVPDYELCSAYRLDASGEVQRIDSRPARAFCFVQTRLSDHSALFSFVAARIQQNPQLLRFFYDLGTSEGQAAAPAIPSVMVASTAATPPAPPPASPLGYPYQLTSALVRELATEADADGAEFVLLGLDSDLTQLDTQMLADAGVETVGIDPAAGPEVPGVRFPNDGHLNEDGHRRVAELLAPRLAELLRP